ncbi:MAG TPA: hypothetical protein DCY20_04000 [Firmicutes bacterium]|nr:hypothetical protein [Bacillota bacterium]
MKKLNVKFVLMVMVVNVLGGLFYVSTPFLVPELKMAGGLGEAAKGFPGFMVLVFSILALIMLAINFGLFMSLATDGAPSAGPVFGLLAHGYSFLAIGAYYGIPSLLICLLSVYLIWRKNLRRV